MIKIKGPVRGGEFLLLDPSAAVKAVNVARAADVPTLAIVVYGPHNCYVSTHGDGRAKVFSLRRIRGGELSVFLKLALGESFVWTEEEKHRNEKGWNLERRP
jgi:hypothetical protein